MAATVVVVFDIPPTLIVVVAVLPLVVRWWGCGCAVAS
jgi:hypothetical protein